MLYVLIGLNFTFYLIDFVSNLVVIIFLYKITNLMNDCLAS